MLKGGGEDVTTLDPGSGIEGMLETGGTVAVLEGLGGRFADEIDRERILVVV